MNKTKQNLIGYLTVLALLLTTSCENELYEEHTIHESNIKRERVNFLKFRENENAFKTYEKLNENKTQSRSQSSRSIDLDTLDFEINFNNGLHLTYHNLESYTFPIRRVVNNGLLENIVISEHTDGKYYAKLLKYNLTAQERVDLTNGELKSIQNPIITEVLGEYTFANRSGICYESVQVITSCGAGVHHGGNIGSWGSCTSSQLPSLKTITVATACDDNEGGGGSSFNYGFGTGNGSEGYYGNLFTGGDAGGSTGYITPSFPNDSTPTGMYQDGISEPVLDIGDGTNPLLNSSTSIGRLLNFLTEEQANFFFHGLDGEAQISILSYIDENTDRNRVVNSQAREFVTQLINNSIESGLIFDIEKSLKSPANIDFSEIDMTTPEGQKLDCIFQKLMQSQSFKDLFDNTFGGTQTKLNVKFQTQSGLTNSNGDNVNGLCSPTQTINGNYYNTITINSDILDGLGQLSNIQVAKTIIHELIHAYLNIKAINCNLGAPLTTLSNTELQTLLNSFFTPFCPINNGQNQHDFMFNELIPVFQSIFSEIRDLLISPNYVIGAENSLVLDQYGNDTGEIFNWNNFYKYISLNGLHLSNTFIQNIDQNPTERGKYEGYDYISNQLNKDCN